MVFSFKHKTPLIDHSSSFFRFEALQHLECRGLSLACFIDKERTEKRSKSEGTKDQAGTSVNKRFYFNVRHMVVRFASEQENETSDK